MTSALCFEKVSKYVQSCLFRSQFCYLLTRFYLLVSLRSVDFCFKTICCSVVVAVSDGCCPCFLRSVADVSVFFPGSSSEKLVVLQLGAAEQTQRSHVWQVRTVDLGQGFTFW